MKHAISSSIALIFLTFPVFGQGIPPKEDSLLRARLVQNPKSCKDVEFSVKMSDDGVVYTVVKQSMSVLRSSHIGSDGIEMRLGSGSCDIAVSIRPAE